MEIKSFFIEDDELLDSLIKNIRMGVLQKDNMDYLTNIKAKMTGYRFFNEGNGKEDFKKIKTYLPKYNISDVWGNLYNKGDSALEHNHTNSEMLLCNGEFHTSGIIYLSDSETGTVFTELGITISAEKGKVILFSPNEFHEVPVVEEKERITIGFNAYESYTR